jgi:hypothetical protein
MITLSDLPNTDLSQDILTPHRIFIFRAHRINFYRQHSNGGKRRLTKWHMSFKIHFNELFWEPSSTRTKTLCKRNCLVSYELPIKVCGVRVENLEQVRQLFTSNEGGKWRTSCKQCYKEFERLAYKRYSTEVKELQLHQQQHKQKQYEEEEVIKQ